MTHALTTTTRALTTTTRPAIDFVTVPRAGSMPRIIKRIDEASASIEDISIYLRAHGKTLTKPQLAVVEYALARAYHREGRNLSVRQVALLCEQTVKQIHHHIRFLGMQVREVLSNDDATRIMCRIMED